MGREIKINDLSAWGIVEVLTVEEASLLWAGIDPAFCESVEASSNKYPQEQYQQAYVTRKAIVSGICLGTLPANEIWCFNPNYGEYEEPYSIHSGKQLPRMSEVVTTLTTVNTKALISWSEKKRILTMKQRLKQSSNEIPILVPKAQHQKPASSHEVVLEIGYSSKHENPPLEVLQEISKEVWDQLDKESKPPKQLIIHDLIKQKYKQRTGVEPSANMIKQIDAIARPPCFKNQGGKQND